MKGSDTKSNDDFRTTYFHRDIIKILVLTVRAESRIFGIFPIRNILGRRSKGEVGINEKSAWRSEIEESARRECSSAVDGRNIRSGEAESLIKVVVGSSDLIGLAHKISINPGP